MNRHMHSIRRLSVLPCLLLLLMVIASACETKPEYPYDPCANDGECTSGKICRGGRCEKADLTCRTDGDCSRGRLCIQATCQSPPCQDDRDCGGGEICIGGYCGLRNDETNVDSADAASTPDAPDTPVNEVSTEGTQETQLPTVCTPNNNGQIDRNELLFKVGTSVTYVEAGSANSTIPVDLQGTRGSDGEIVWDFSQTYPGSTKVVDTIQSLNGAWFLDKYANATHAVILERSLKFFGVFQATDSDLLMQGLVSQAKDSTQLKYDTPVSLFKFPLALGQKWTSTGTLGGTFNTIPFYKMHETYVFEVDAKGKVKTPAGTFPVVRLKLFLTQQQYSPSFFRRTGYSYFFVSECYGVVVTVDSKTYETNALFTQAARIKRLSE